MNLKISEINGSMAHLATLYRAKEKHEIQGK